MARSSAFACPRQSRLAFEIMLRARTGREPNIAPIAPRGLRRQSQSEGRLRFWLAPYEIRPSTLRTPSTIRAISLSVAISAGASAIVSPETRMTMFSSAKARRIAS